MQTDQIMPKSNVPFATERSVRIGSRVMVAFVPHVLCVKQTGRSHNYAIMQHNVDFIFSWR